MTQSKRKFKPTHVPLEQRTTLNARLMASEIFDANEIIIEDKLTKSRWENFKNSYLAKANEPSFSKKIRYLDEFLKKLPKRFNGEVKELSFTDEFYKIESMISQLFEELRDFSCENCNAVDKVCEIDENQKHDAIKDGICLERFHDIFNSFEKLARDFYSISCCIDKNKINNEVIFSTSFNSRDDIHDFDVDVYANGKTIVRDEDKKIVSEVMLQFLVTKFDWNTYCSLPYIVAHELFCHAFQGIINDDKKREETPSKCAFTEGFVDRAVLEILISAVNRKGLVQDFKLPPGDVKYSASISRRTWSFHEARRERHRGILFQLRNYGAQAIERLAKYLGGYAKGGSPDWDNAIRATLSLNAKRLSFEDRNMVSTLVHTALLRPESPAAAELLGLFKELAIDGVKGVDVFLEELRSLKERSLGRVSV